MADDQASLTQPTVLEQVARLTGYDADQVSQEGNLIVVAGPPGSGVTSLVAACRELRPDLNIAEFSPSLLQEAVLGVLLIDPSSAADEDDYVLLSTMRARLGLVALVGARIDAFWEWPRILRGARAHLDPREQMPIFATSAAACLAGAADESGVDELVDWLATELADPNGDRRQRAQRAAARGAVDHALDTAELDSDSDAEVAELVERRKALVAGRDRGRTDRLAALRTGLNRARTDVQGEVVGDVRALSRQGARRCAELGRGQVDGYVAWVRAGAETIAARSAKMLDDRLNEVRRTILLGTDSSATGGNGIGPGSIDQVLSWQAPPKPRRAGEDALLMVLGASTGLGVGRLIVSPMEQVATLQWVSMPITLLLGVAVAAWVIRSRRLTLRRQQLRTWTTETLTEVRGWLERSIVAAVTDADAQIAGQITRHHERRLRSVSGEVGLIDERLTALRTAGGQAAQRRRELIALQSVLAADPPTANSPKIDGTVALSAASKGS